MIGQEEPVFWRADALPHIGKNFRSGPMDLTIAHSEHRRIDEDQPLKRWGHRLGVGPCRPNCPGHEDELKRQPRP